MGDRYVFEGPSVAISCEVVYDVAEERYFAEGEGWVGFSGHSPKAAALNCFQGWLTDEGVFYRGSMIERPEVA
jgi:hypothetical protein